MYGRPVKRKVPAPGPYVKREIEEAPGPYVDREIEEAANGEDDFQDGGQEETDPSCKVYVGGLNFGTHWRGLKELFETVGMVTFVKIMREQKIGGPMKQQGWWSRGTAVVQFSSPEEAEGAVETLNAFELDGHKIVVDAWDATGASGNRRAANGVPAGLQVCPYFKEGRCHKGEACQWSHSGGILAILGVGGRAGGGFPRQPGLPQARGALGPGGVGGGAAKVAKVCPYFPLGTCDKGANCKWVHAPAAPPFPILGAGAGAGPGAGKICPYFPLGKCDKGSDCKWIHRTGGGAGASAGAGAGWIHRTGGGAGASAGAGAGGGKVCPFFPLGKCDKGANCKWVHQGSGGGGAGGGGVGKICPYFIQNKCDKGAACRWVHP